MGRYNYNTIAINSRLKNDEDATTMEEEEFEEVEVTKVLKEYKIPLYKNPQTMCLVIVPFLLNCFMDFEVSNACAHDSHSSNLIHSFIIQIHLHFPFMCNKFLL